MISFFSLFDEKKFKKIKSVWNFIKIEKKNENQFEPFTWLFYSYLFIFQLKIKFYDLDFFLFKPPLQIDPFIGCND